MIIKMKKKFSQRWSEQFVKNYPGIESLLSGKFVTKEELFDAMFEMIEYVMTVGKGTMTAKKFAKLLSDKDKLVDYGASVQAEAIALSEKPEPKPKKAKKTAKKKASKKKSK